MQVHDIVADRAAVASVSGLASADLSGLSRLELGWLRSTPSTTTRYCHTDRKEQQMTIRLPCGMIRGVGVAATAAVVGSGMALVAPHATLAAPSSTASAKTVTIKNFAFNPATVIIRHGTSIRWINRDSTTHTTTSNTGRWSKTLAPGKSFTFTFRKAGRYRYHCQIHPTMTGIVRVT